MYRLSGWNQNIKNLPCIRLKRRPYFTYSDVRALRFKIIFHPFYLDFNFRHSRPVELIQMIDFEPQNIEYFAKPKTSCQFDRASTLDTFWSKEKTPINYKLFANIKKIRLVLTLVARGRPLLYSMHIKNAWPTQSNWNPGTC